MINAARLSRVSPLGKLGFWALGVCLLGAAMQLAATAIGADFSVFEKSSGGTALIVAAFALLLAMMAVESRPLADYGLVTDAGWLRRWLIGFAAGAGCYAAYCAAAWAAGVIQIDPGAATPVRWLKAVFAGMSAAPVAVTGQIIFSGYLLSTLRDRHSRFVAVLVPALLFAFATAVARPGGLAGDEGQRLFVGMLLLQSLLGVLRLRTGSIVLPAGVLAGCILVRKVASKSRLIGFNVEHEDAWWLAPAGDPRQGPALATLLVVAVSVAALALWKWGERRLEPDTGVDAAFKRYMPLSNLLGLAPLERWAVLLWRARFRVGLWYVPRLVASLVGSTVSTALALPERVVAPMVLRRPPPPPVFIVGMPRSGTTHLHNLLALDPQFRSPRNYEVFNPHGFLTGWLTTACLTPFLTWRRPMDAVQMTVFSAQEEEFALAAMGSPSPYWSFCLPREIGEHDRYWRPEGFTEAERAQWERHYTRFLRKLTCWRRRTPLLKNPANTGRIAMLTRLFPEAKFIHIVRHPHVVWQSNQRLAEHGLAVFQLQDPLPDDNYATRALANYRRLMDAFYRDTASLDERQVVEVRFEDLEAEPGDAVRAVYGHLGLGFTDSFGERLDRYLQSVSGYRKNRFPNLSDGERKAIDRVMAPYLDAWGYNEPIAPAHRAA